MTTVLVVDDEYLIVEVLTLALEDVGFMVTQASNGKKALDALHREGPSLVVCDFMMPLMNGLELAEEIRRRSEWSHIPIVLMSGGHAGWPVSPQDFLIIFCKNPSMSPSSSTS